MKIASFNIQKFGLHKISDPTLLSILVKIVSRYDIIVILEVVDVSGNSVDRFLKELNKMNQKHPYTLKISSRLGRSRYKEQFMFLYRDGLVDLVGSYQYEDNQVGDEDAFAREPYILRFTCLNTGFVSVTRGSTFSAITTQAILPARPVVTRLVPGDLPALLKDLVLIPVHTKPDDSEKELDELYDVFLTVKKKWKTDNVMILGDFNADGGYVSNKKMKGIRIRSDKNFHWLIGDDVDTTASTGNANSYDRIVVYGDDMLNAVVPNSAQPFNFQKAFELTEEEALHVSDHYPVEVELKTRGPSGQSSGDQHPAQVKTNTDDEDMMELKRGNLLLEREKLNLEIQMLRLQITDLEANRK